MREVQITNRYKLREDGKVFDINTGYEKTLCKCKKGYRIIIQRKEYSIHQLVMKYFGQEKPGDNYVIVHINGNNLDNRLENLKWSSRSEARCTLPLGLRKCDFETETEYNRAMSKLHRVRHGVEDNKKCRERYASDEEYRIKQVEKAKTYQKNNLETCKERQKKWALNNPEKAKMKRKRHKLKLKKYNSIKSSEYHKKHKDKSAEANKRYRLKHPEAVRYSHEKYYLKKKAKDISP